MFRLLIIVSLIASCRPVSPAARVRIVVDSPFDGEVKVFNDPSSIEPRLVDGIVELSISATRRNTFRYDAFPKNWKLEATFADGSKIGTIAPLADARNWIAISTFDDHETMSVRMGKSAK